MLHRETANISKVALRWTAEGKRKRGCPKSTCRGTAETTSGSKLCGLPRTDTDRGVLLIPFVSFGVSRMDVDDEWHKHKGVDILSFLFFAKTWDLAERDHYVPLISIPCHLLPPQFYSHYQ